MIAAIRERVPAYRRPLRGRFGVGIRLGVEEALGQFVDLIADPELERSAASRVYRGLGAGEYRERRTLDALLDAYRLGARVSWRRIASLAIEAEVDRSTLAVLADAVFAYIDELSALSADGYAEAQSVEAGETQRRRRRLARLLLGAHPDPAAIAAAAEAAEWDPPAKLAVIAWRGEARRLRSRLPLDSLVLEEDGEDGTVALLGDPGAPGLRARLERGAEGLVAVIGPEAGPDEVAASAARARAVLSLIAAGTITATGLVQADDHLAEMVTHAEPAALDELSRRRLAPLAAETPGSRTRLTETLRAWLDHQGAVAAVAAELGIHPQTVRYRLGRLHDLFGSELERPESRYELALALRGSRFEAPAAGTSP